ncbi:glycosyltransferase family 1 protein [Bacteroides sp. GD17]|jgi:glycosyltransferase involved in cell wall biosynthesis|uniref:glycosyltransferase family 4 protein n=1 Tax=Bacteroides sp. GD17 TaxID=3139826 RepID=UPI0025DAB8A6|nr:glycosyltransferase family 1 protein [uncultured Bacteroides sp.]
MKIGIEAQRIFRIDKHGMDFVILEVLRNLQNCEDGNENEYVVFVAPGEDVCLKNSPRMQIVELCCPSYPLWEQWALPKAIRKYGVELLHCTSNTAPLHCPVPLILTLHDIIYLNTKKGKGMSAYQQLGWYYRRWNVPRVLKQCRHIITVSETERTNILNRFPEIADHLSVVHNGYSECYRLLPTKEAYAITSKYLPDEHYLLFLGNTDPRKNTEGVLLAYKKYLNESKKPLRLVITGLKKEYVEDMLIKLGIEICTSNLVYTGYVPGSDLPSLYNNAFAFLYPSLLEGFGIPVLEAMACGVPVITSNCSSLPEVAGEGGILVNPQLPQEIAEAILQLEKNEDLRRHQRDYGLNRAKLFSWQYTTKQYLKIYTKMQKV